MSDDEFERRVNKYPSSFQLQLEGVNKRVVTNVLDRLLREYSEDISDCDEEVVRKNNLISFLYWNVEKKKEAFEHNQYATDKDENSVVAIANRAHYLYENHEFYDADQCLNRLEKLTNHKLYARFYTSAKAELAYSYSRFGPKFHQKSAEEFEHVILEKGDNYLWKFGLGLNLQRQVHIYNNPNYFDISLKEKFQKALDVFHDVVTHTRDTDNVLCAKAWVEIGGLLYQKYKNIDPDIDSVKLPQGLKDLKYSECFEIACSISNNDVFVLERAGKFSRYSYQLEKSEDLLRKAIQLRETAFSHHHLALTLRKLAFKRSCSKYGRSKSFPTESDQVSAGNYRSTNINVNTVSRQLFRDCESNTSSLDSGVNSVETDLLAEESSRNTFQHTQYGDKSLNDAQGKIDEISSGIVNLSIETHAFDSGYYERQHYASHQADRGSGNRRREIDRGYPFENLRGGGRIRGRSLGNERGNCGLYRGRPCRKVDRGLDRGHGIARGRGRGFSNEKHSENRVFRSYSTENARQKRTQALINSPAKVKISPGNPLLEKAVDHFKRSVDLTRGCNVRAQYELGLTYMMLGKNEEALDALKCITSQSQHVNQMELVSAYEQQGLCLQRISEVCPSPEKDKHIFNSRHLFFKAIELASNAVAAMPVLKTAWAAFPTLRDLLETKSKKDLKDFTELAKLHELMFEHGKSIEFYEEILKLSSNPSQREKAQYAIAQNYVRLRDYDNAILLLSLLSCTGDSKVIDRQFYLDTYISGALHALQNGENQKCSERFQEAFKFCFPCQKDQENEENFDIHIIADDDENPEVIYIERLLAMHCQLKVTVNQRDCLPGRLKSRSTIASLKSSSCIISVIHSNELSGQTEYFIEYVITSKKTMVVVAVDGATVPDHLETFPSTDIQKITEKGLETCNETWLEQFFRKLGKTAKFR